MIGTVPLVLKSAPEACLGARRIKAQLLGLFLSATCVKIGLGVLTRPVADELLIVYRTLSGNYNEKVLPSIIHETLKAVVAQYNASQLITQREAVSREIRIIMTERAANFNIALYDVSITSLTFGREFTTAIEAKQVAAQEAERAKFVVEKAEQDKRSAIIRAQVTLVLKSAPEVRLGARHIKA
ncbi:putative prohibitin, Band 7 domain, Band 7/SPFH domain superfamily [Helianthus debilis subsp. tardiflorus]